LTKLSHLHAASRLLFAVGSAALLSGCAAVGPNYERPQVPTPEQFRFVQDGAQAQSLADSPWWQVFDDPTLQALVREALTNNLDLQRAVARGEEARARAGGAKSLLYPQIDRIASYSARPASNTSEEDGSSAANDRT